MEKKVSNSEILLIDEQHKPILTEGECEKLKPIVNDFVRGYAENENLSVEKWLNQKLRQHLPEKSNEEIGNITEEIISTIKISDEKKTDLEKHVSQGRDKESWFAKEAKQATSLMSSHQAITYLNNLDIALENANDALQRTITTQAGIISQNPSLDGFIAEQYHAQTFNLNAEATGSPYRAKVLESNGEGFAKNSVDIVIVDLRKNPDIETNTDYVRKYQSKYCKDAKATEKAFESGDYRGQQKLVPEGQEGEIVKKCTTVIEAPDGTKSNPLSKENAQKLRDEAQSGNWNDLNWSEYKTKDLAIGIGKQAGYAALQGAAIGVGIDIARKLWNGEEIKGEEVVETALISGADFGIKAATAGALKVGVEKNIIKVIPKGTPASTLANIAFVAIENAKVFRKVISGEYTLREGLEKMQLTTVSTIAGIASSAKGTAIGVAIGTVFGPVGTAVGGFIGGSIGYIAGSKIGEFIVKSAHKIRDKSREIVHEIVEGAKRAGRKIHDWVSDKWYSFKTFFA